MYKENIMDKKLLVNIYMDAKRKEFIKQAAKKMDRSLSSYIRIMMTARAEKDLGKEYKDGDR